MFRIKFFKIILFIFSLKIFSCNNSLKYDTSLYDTSLKDSSFNDTSLTLKDIKFDNDIEYAFLFDKENKIVAYYIKANKNELIKIGYYDKINKNLTMDILPSAENKIYYKFNLAISLNINIENDDLFSFLAHHPYLYDIEKILNIVSICYINTSLMIYNKNYKGFFKKINIFIQKL